MKAKFLFTMLILVVGWTARSQAQERGLFKKNPKIKSNKVQELNTPVIKPQKDEFDEFEKETPQMRFSNTFEPVKEVNPTVADDTTAAIDEGETSVAEVIDSVQVGDDWVQVADYYVIWDSKTIDPYNLNPLEFEDNLNLKLYDTGKGRYWNLPTSEVKVTSQFGPRWGRWHEGMDLDCNTGDPIYSTYDGIVRVVAYDGNAAIQAAVMATTFIMKTDLRVIHSALRGFGIFQAKPFVVTNLYSLLACGITSEAGVQLAVNSILANLPSKELFCTVCVVVRR